MKAWAVGIVAGLVTYAAWGVVDEREVAGQILAADGVRPGLIVHLGCGDGSLTAELARDGKRIVHGLCTEPRRVAELRDRIAAEVGYGRVAVDAGSAASLPYASDLVNLLVVHRLTELRTAGFSIAEVMRVLCPGGMAYLGQQNGPIGEKALQSLAAESGAVEHEVIRRAGTWLRLVKGRPGAADEWTHFEYDATRSSVSGDGLVGPPTSLRWLAGEQWPDKRFGHKPDAGFASAGGRNFYWYSRRTTSTRSLLTCRDAYNGVLLWEKDIDRPAHTTLLVARDSRVYVHTGGEGGLVALDAASGREVLRFNGSHDDKNAEILVHDGVLVERSGGGVRAFDEVTGALLWDTPDAFAGSDAIVIGEGSVFCLGGDAAESPTSLIRRDLRTGKEMWRANVSSLRHVLSPGIIAYRDGIVLLSSSPRPHRFAHKADKWAALYALSAADGRQLWKYEYEATPHFGRATNVLFFDDLIWIKLSAGDPKDKAAYSWVALGPESGKEARRFVGQYNRCYSDRATPRFILTGDLDFVDPLTGERSGSKVSRGACNSGFMPANGLTYTFHFGCNCYNFLRGLIALSSEPVPEIAVPVRLERGPAFGAAKVSTAGSDDWPTFRHDSLRTASTTAAAPTELAVAWDTPVARHVSSPTVTEGRVLVAAVDEHRVVCLDAATGEIEWSYRTGGRVDSPPTLHDGLALFGSADGWVYCLRADDGTLVWRLHAAPADRRIVVRGQIESSWPVHGSVLVQGGIAYFAAGRHTQADGGLCYYAADPATGGVLWSKQVGGEIRDCVNEVLIGDGISIHLGQRIHFDPETGEAPRSGSRVPVLFSMWGLLADNTTPGTDSGGMTFHVRPWAYTQAPPRVEPRGISWNHPLKGNILAVRGGAVYGIVEQWRSTPRPRHRVWELFGKPSGEAEKWTVEADYEHKPESLVLAGDVLFFARRGIESQGGEMWALAAADGRILNRISLPAAPRWDGVAAANGRLFVATQDGRVICLGRP